MKDLDFDELDRAVNSLMSSASKSEDTTLAADTEEKTLDITPTLSGDTLPSLDNLKEALASTTDKNEDKSQATPQKSEGSVVPSAMPAPATAAPTSVPTRSSVPPATRRGGRFMDVVHPSADMKKTDSPARSVSRQGTTIMPTPDTPPKLEMSEASKDSEQKTDEKNTVQAQPDATSLEKPMPLAVPSQPPTESHTTSGGDWPDPLDMAGFKSDKESDVAPSNEEVEASKENTGDIPKPETAPEIAPEMATKDKAEEKEEAPLTSPFLPGAKVEKRPLGTDTTAVEEPDRAPVLGAASADKKTVDDPNAQLPASPEEIEPELPEELKGDLVAIEADTTTHPQPMPAENAPSSVLKEKDDASDMPEKPVSLNASESDRNQEEKAPPVGPTSIPQQYKEEPSTGDKNNGSIYDTSTYHQPLAHPEKKRSGWLVVVWIVIVLLLGAAGGAALYLSGIL